MLVVAYALAGTVDIDFEKQPLGQNASGKDVYLRDIWPTRDTIVATTQKHVKPEYFREVYSKIAGGTERWNALNVSQDIQYGWKESSTYISNPPFFQNISSIPPQLSSIKDAYCLLNLGDFVTTDHISPAGNIAKNSPAARYLQEKGVKPHDFNTYGARRGKVNFYDIFLYCI